MKVNRLKEECIFCLVNRFGKAYAENATEKEKIEYLQGVLKIISKADFSESAPALVEKISALQKKIWGKAEDYTEAKKHFNNLLLNMEEEIEKRIAESENPIEEAVKYSMMGNYIDFGIVENVKEDKLSELIGTASDIKVDEKELKNLENDLKRAKKLVFLTDNCGEVVFDKVLMKEISKKYPGIKIDVIVRGGDVLNDVTIDDAKQVGLLEMFNVVRNGSKVPGTCLEKINRKAKKLIDNADVLISKGQGNFETVRHCEKNVYYIFMCKCEMFARDFGVPLYSGMLVNDLRM